MNKKKKIFIYVGIFLVLAAIFYFVEFFVFDTGKNRTTAISRSEKLSLDWGNYEQEASGERLESLKQFFSEELYDSYKQDFETLSKMNEKFGPSPKSIFEIQSSEVSRYNLGVYTLKIIGTREFPELSEKKDAAVTIELKKIWGKLKVVSLEEEAD